jgi:hypothetical protein
VEFKQLMFMIEGGRALELVKHHIAERYRVAKEVRALALDLGVDNVWTSHEDGTVRRVQFNDIPHPEFTKADKNGSRPKKGTAWAARFAAQKGYENPSNVIAEAFDIPLGIKYGRENGKGWTLIGYPLRECGFLWLSDDGPYAMWIPDVPAEVAAKEKDGYTVDQTAKSFKPEFDGCRLIEPEEWEILVAQHNLATKRAAQTKEA